jgi:hypothetical protein
MSARNVDWLGAPIRLFNGDYRRLLGVHRFPAGRRIIAFLAPPWADALSSTTGLDLGRTKPPIAEIVADIDREYPDTPILYAVEVHERLAADPLAALRAGFEWSELSIYDLAGPTGRHGVLLGTRRWWEVGDAAQLPFSEASRPFAAGQGFRSWSAGDRRMKTMTLGLLGSEILPGLLSQRQTQMALPMDTFKDFNASCVGLRSWREWLCRVSRSQSQAY